MKKLIVLCLLCLGCFAAVASPTTNAPSVTLGWDMTTDVSVDRYRVYWGTATRQYTNSVTVVGRTNTTAVIGPLARNVLYFFAATCVATNSLESDYSTEVSYRTLPIPPAPIGVRVQVLDP